MRILVISSARYVLRLPQGPAGDGGLEAVAWHTAKGLVSLGHEICLAAPDGSECPGTECVWFGPPGSLGKEEDACWDRCLPLLLRFDIIIDHSLGKRSLALEVEGRLRIPCLRVFHLEWSLASPLRGAKPCIVCVSEDQKSEYVKAFGGEAKVVYPGVDMDFYRPTGSTRSDRFLWLGRYSERRGPDLAIEACKQADAELDLYGDSTWPGCPEKKGEYAEFCKALAGNGKIEVHGPLNRTETVSIFNRANCLLHTNARLREPFGLVPVEAQACGLPVVAWRTGGPTETVVDGETGWLVDSLEGVTDRVKEIKRNGIPDLMRKRCREWVADRYNIEMMAKRYEQLCREAIECPW